MLAPWKCSEWRHSNENLFSYYDFPVERSPNTSALSLLLSWFHALCVCVWHFRLYIVYTWLHIHFAALRFHLPNNKCCHSMLKNADGDEHHHTLEPLGALFMASGRHKRGLNTERFISIWTSRTAMQSANNKLSLVFSVVVILMTHISSFYRARGTIDSMHYFCAWQFNER